MNRGRLLQRARRHLDDVEGTRIQHGLHLAAEIEDIRLRVRAFIEKHVIPLEADPANYAEHENIRLDAPRARCAPRRRRPGLWAPQSPKEFGGMGLPIVAWAAMYEEADRSIFGPLAFNCLAPDDGNMNVLRQGRHAGAEGKMAAADRRRQGALVLRHDRARARRRLRSRHDPHPRREEGRQLGDPRPQVVHHRRRRRRALHPDGAHLRRSAPRPHGVPVPQGPAGLAHRAPHPDHGAGGARRPLRARVRRARSAGRERADGRGRRAAS